MAKKSDAETLGNNKQTALSATKIILSFILQKEFFRIIFKENHHFEIICNVIINTNKTRKMNLLTTLTNFLVSGYLFTLTSFFTVYL